MNIGEQRSGADRFSRPIANFAQANGASHFVTLKPGLHNLSKYDADRELAPLIGKLLESYARRVRGVPHSRTVTAEDVPFLVGAPELFNGSRNLDPHFHGLIALGDGEEPQLRGLLREQWGVDMTAGAETLQAFLPEKGLDPAWRSFYPSIAVPVTARPSGWLLRGANFQPSFDLQTLDDQCERVASYITKQALNPTIWTHAELLDTKRPAQLSKTKTPARIRH